MNLKKQLINGMVGTLSVRVVGTGLAFLLSVFLARTLGADGFGLYSFVLSLIIFFSIPLQAGFPNLVVRETAKNHAKQNWLSIKGLVFWVLKMFLIYVLGIGLLIALLFTFDAYVDFFENERASLFLMGFVLVPLIPLLLIQNALVRGLGRVVLGIIPDVVIRPGLTLVIAVFLFYAIDGLNPSTALISYIVSIFIAVLLSLIFVWHLIPKTERNLCSINEELDKWKQAAYPLSVVGGLQLMYSYIDIIILGFFHSNEDVGVYRAIGQLGMLVVFGLSAINQMLHSHFARLYANNEMDKLQKIVTYSSLAIFAIAAIPSLIFIFAGEFVLTIVFGDEYVAGVLPLIILTLGQLANAIFGSVGALLNMTGHEKEAMKGMFYSLGVNITLSLILIPAYGMLGAAIATAVSLFAWNVILRHYVKKRLNIETIGFIQLYKDRRC